MHFLWAGWHLGISRHHDLIQARRAEQRSQVFRTEMQVRAGIESVVSELVRGHGLRRARYCGQPKVQRQALFSGAAANLKRLAQTAYFFAFGDRSSYPLMRLT